MSPYSTHFFTFLEVDDAAATFAKLLPLGLLAALWSSSSRHSTLVAEEQKAQTKAYDRGDDPSHSTPSSRRSKDQRAFGQANPLPLRPKSRAYTKNLTQRA